MLVAKFANHFASVFAQSLNISHPVNISRSKGSTKYSLITLSLIAWSCMQRLITALSPVIIPMDVREGLRELLN